MQPPIVALVEDLFFLARIQETAKSLGLTVTAVDRRSDVTRVAAMKPSALIIDLNARGLDPIVWIRALKADRFLQSVPLVAFASHVETQLIAQARAAGCDTVLARSAFTRQLPDLLRHLAAPLPQGA